MIDHLLQIRVLQIRVLQIHLLQIRVLQIRVLQIRVLQIRVLQIQSVFYKSNPVHVLQYAENFSLDVLHFDPKHRTFNFVSIVCIALTFLSFVWFAAAIV